MFSFYYYIYFHLIRLGLYLIKRENIEPFFWYPVELKDVISYNRIEYSNNDRN